MSPIERILIIRTSAIGDVIFASPLIGALRQRYPQAHIAWLAEPPVREMLSRHPQLDEVIVWDKAAWRRLWRERRFGALWRAMRSFARELRSRNFDTAIDAQGLLKSGVWAWLSGAPRRIGLGSREGSRHLMTEVIDKPAASDMIGSEYRELARRLGLVTTPFPMRVGVGPEDREYAGSLLRASGVEGGYVVICPFTTRPQKHWFDEQWRALAASIREEFELPVVVLGGPGDRSAASALVAGNEIIDLTGRTSIVQAAAIVAGCRLLVGVDTGLTHLGTAFERPTVCLFGSTRPYLRTDSALTRVIYHPRDCSPCRRNPVCNGAFACMREITPAQVMAASRQVMTGAA